VSWLFFSLSLSLSLSFSLSLSRSLSQAAKLEREKQKRLKKRLGGVSNEDLAEEFKKRARLEVGTRLRPLDPRQRRHSRSIPGKLLCDRVRLAVLAEPVVVAVVSL
jgi:hypothetical protein